MSEFKWAPDPGTLSRSQWDTLPEAAPELYEALIEFGEHARDCVLARWEAGEPREDGYYVKFAGKWYREGEAPRCECGLDDVLARARGEGEK